MNKVKKKENPVNVIKENPKRMKKITVRSNNVIIRYDLKNIHVDIVIASDSFIN